MEKIISYGIFFAIIFGLIVPFGENYKFLIPILLSIVLFFNFLNLKYKFNNFFQKELLYYLIIGLGIIPFFVFLLTQNIDLNLRLGIFIISITPTAISAPIIVNLIKGNRELIISNVILYNLLSPITYTFLLNIYFSKSDLTIPTKQLFIKLVLMIFIPLILALIVRNFINFKEKLLRVSKFASPISFILVITIAVSSTSLYFKKLTPFILIQISIIVFILTTISFLIAFYISKNNKSKKTLSVVFGHKNTALAAWIILSNFAPVVVIPTIIYIICHHIINGVLIHKYINR